MRKNIIRILCLTFVAGLAFSACKPDPVNPDKYTVTVKSADETMGKAYGGGQFDPGSTTRIWGTPEVGYQFDHWNDGNTDNPRNITVDGDVTYTAYFKEVGGDNPGGGGGDNPGGDTPGEFSANFTFDGTTYQGVALVSFGIESGVMVLAVYTGEGETDPIAVVNIPPATGNYTADGTTYTGCSLVFGSNDYVTTSEGYTYPHYGTALNGVVNINVTALDLTAGTITLAASGQLLDIATHQSSGQAVYKPFTISMDGFWQTPGTPTAKSANKTYKYKAK